MVSLLRRRRPMPALEDRVAVHRATDGRDILLNTPDGWEVDQPWLWWLGQADGSSGPWGNPPPGADPSSWLAGAPGVTRCTSLIADTLAGLPWFVYGPDDMQQQTPEWIADPAASRQDGRITDVGMVDDVRLSPVEFWTQYITAALWWGDAYIYAPIRDAAGAPKPPLFQLYPSDVSIRDGRYWVSDIALAPGSIIHLRGEPPYFGGHGNGVFTRHNPDLWLALTIQKYAAGEYRSGVPAGYLKSSQPHMDEDAAAKLKASWMNAHSGRRSIAVLNATTDFAAVQRSPIESALDAAQTWSLRTIALAFCVQPFFLGVPGDSATYANVESRAIELKEYTLMPWIRRLESCLDAQLPRGTTVKIKTAGLERADTLTRAQVYTMALGNGTQPGWLTQDDVRALEDLPPMAEDDPYNTGDAAPDPTATAP